MKRKGLLTDTIELWFHKITGLKDDQEIREFMKFCTLEVKFILEASDYELYLAIRNCYVEYAQPEMPLGTPSITRQHSGKTFCPSDCYEKHEIKHIHFFILFSSLFSPTMCGPPPF